MELRRGRLGRELRGAWAEAPWVAVPFSEPEVAIGSQAGMRLCVGWSVLSGLLVLYGVVRCSSVLFGVVRCCSVSFGVVRCRSVS